MNTQRRSYDQNKGRMELFGRYKDILYDQKLPMCPGLGHDYVDSDTIRSDVNAALERECMTNV